MATTLGTPTTPTRNRQPLALSVVVAVVLVVAYVAYDRLVVQHLVPRLVGHWPESLIGLLRFLVQAGPYLLLALVLIGWGIDAGRRLLGALAAVATGVVAWGVPYAYQKLVYEQGNSSVRLIELYFWLMVLLLPTGLALAWGLARRTGRLWAAGVLVAPALSAVHYELQHHNPDFLSWEFHHQTWWFNDAEFLTPVVLACLLCWALEHLERNPPEIGSSA